MKKFMAGFVLIFIAFFSGCDENRDSGLQSLLGEQPVVATRGTEYDTRQAIERPPAGSIEDQTTPTTAPEGYTTNQPNDIPTLDVLNVDIDLTRMSVTMVSAQVMQIMLFPEDHIGQTIRIRGSHLSFDWLEADMVIHYVVLDLTAGCCGQGIEFILPKEIKEAIGYIPQGAVLDIVGIYSSYEVFDTIFHYISVIDIVVS